MLKCSGEPSQSNIYNLNNLNISGTKRSNIYES